MPESSGFGSSGGGSFKSRKEGSDNQEQLGAWHVSPMVAAHAAQLSRYEVKLSTWWAGKMLW